jgi:short-subunit dehydrogenase
VAVTVVYPGFVETPLTAKNDFPMPFMVSADKAASIILTKAESRPLTIAFPLRLHLLLRTMAFFSRLWYQVLAPKLSRSASS